MALVATYGDSNAYNIKIYDMVGGGYYATLNDSSTQVFQRRNSAGSTDTHVVAGGTAQWLVDHFLSYSYDSTTSTLTLTGASDTVNGITFTRTETYKFISSYIVEDTFSITSNATATVDFTNWNYYGTINAVWDIDNTNLGDGISTRSLGIGVQLVSNGSVYGVIGDSNYANFNNTAKRALVAQTAIAATWINTNYTLNDANGFTLALKQWFFKSSNTLRDFMLQAILAVASAKNFTGSQWDKVCQVTAYLNNYRRSDLASVMMIPSNNYNTAMYMRDSFWQSFVMTDELEQKAITSFESVQNTSTGRVPERIGNDGSTVSHDDDSTLLYIIRAYYDYTYRGLKINTSKVTKAMTYVNTMVSNAQYQINSSDSGIKKSWMDGFVFTTGTYSGYLQGLYCVALKCVKALGLGATTSDITNAATQYQALYDSSLGFVRFASDQSFMSPDVFVGEALSIWLFGDKLLTQASVHQTITSLVSKAKTPAGMKVIADSTGAYIATTSFSPSLTQGDYQNGGSWFLYEYLAYYAAFYHSYPGAKALLNNRIAVEMGSEPVSHEYLQTTTSIGSYLSETAARHGYSWNAASYVIKPSSRQPLG